MLAVARSSLTAVTTQLRDFGGQSLQDKIVVRSVQFLVIFSPKTSHFLVVVAILVLQSPKFLQI